MVKAKEMLSEVKESIINSYEVKTKLSRSKIIQSPTTNLRNSRKNWVSRPLYRSGRGVGANIIA